jgi:regulator of protease activity HflC (stomatin/prohibitin superfamily)
MNKKINFISVFVVFFLLTSLSVGLVPVGYRGIATRLGNVTGKIRGQGIFFKVPFIEGNKNIEVRVQKEETTATAASKDLQSVTAKVALNFRVEPERVVSLYQEIGMDYKERRIIPALQESVKATTAKYTAEELITRRAEVRDGIKLAISEKMGNNGIFVEDFNIVDFDFSESFNKAIEAKVTAEQDALAAKNKLEQVKYEAEQRVAQAKGEAEAIKIQSEAIQAQGGENYVQLQAIKQWKGDVPQYMMGNAVPFINLGK